MIGSYRYRQGSPACALYCGSYRHVRFTTRAFYGTSASSFRFFAGGPVIVDVESACCSLLPSALKLLDGFAEAVETLVCSTEGSARAAITRSYCGPKVFRRSPPSARRALRRATAWGWNFLHCSNLSNSSDLVI